MNDIAQSVIKKLKKQGSTIAVAESITGGGLGQALTSVSGSSEVMLGGIVAYSDSVKVKFLNISRALLKKQTAVSEEVAREMAISVRNQFKSTYGIATTGVAGPGKAYGQKAGTVWIAISTKKEVHTVALALTGDREAIRNATIASTLATFERILSL